MCVNRHDSEKCLEFLNAEILNMAKFWIKQVFQNASVTQPTEYARICLDRVLDLEYGRVPDMQELHRVLNMPQ